MSDIGSVSDFARRCWELVEAMNDKTQPQEDRDDARQALTEWIRAHYRRPIVELQGQTQAGRDD